MKNKNYYDNEIKYKLQTCNILGVNINVTNMKDTVSYIKKNLEQLKGNYVCISNVHTTIMSYEDEKYKNIQNSGALALPDGGPLSVVSRNKGFKEAERVTGPDLMEEIFKISEETGYRHYFYGSTENTLYELKDKLKNKYKNLNIVGMYSPPFRKLLKSEDEEIIKEINDKKPDFVWIGLGAPKQEVWMYEHKNKIVGVMIGVGAGFDYHAEVIKRAPMWMQKLSLEWLYRLCQDPKRLLKRYIKTNLKFLYLYLYKNF